MLQTIGNKTKTGRQKMLRSSELAAYNYYIPLCIIKDTKHKTKATECAVCISVSSRVNCNQASLYRVKGNEPDDSNLQGIHPRWSDENLGSYARRTHKTHQRLHSTERSLPAPVQQDQAKTPRVPVRTTVWFQVLHLFTVWMNVAIGKILVLSCMLLAEKV